MYWLGENYKKKYLPFKRKIIEKEEIYFVKRTVIGHVGLLHMRDGFDDVKGSPVGMLRPHVTKNSRENEDFGDGDDDIKGHSPT